MSRILEISYEGRESSFSITRISRSKLYGSKRRIPVDGQENECSKASLTRDGMYILPTGGMAMLYLDESGNVVERDRLRAIDIYGGMLKPGKRVLNGGLEVEQIVQATDLLECTIAHIYALEAIFLSQELGSLLSHGDIILLTLPTPTNHLHRRLFLLGNDAGYFLLIGQVSGFEFIGLTEADLSPPAFFVSRPVFLKWRNDPSEGDDYNRHAMGEFGCNIRMASLTGDFAVGLLKPSLSGHFPNSIKARMEGR
jgi:hypothetical protein